MKHASLFSGIGGFDLAAEWMGWENVFHCENDLFLQRVLKYYWPNAKSYNDITKTDFTQYCGTIDILTGGFPCQPFSVAGKRKGKEDNRFLWPEMRRAIREIKPRIIVAENVAGLFTILEPDSISEMESKEIELFCQNDEYPKNLIIERIQRRIIGKIIEDIRSEGYFLPELTDGTPVICCIPACAVNAIHRRDRVWIVAYSRDYLWEKNTGNAVLAKKDICMDFEKRVIADPGYIGQTECKKQTTGIIEPSVWQGFPTKPPVCSGDDGLPTELDGITFQKWRNESTKAYGNAIVPQEAYQIFKAIGIVCGSRIIS